MHLSFFHVFLWFDSSFLFSASYYILKEKQHPSSKKKKKCTKALLQLVKAIEELESGIGHDKMYLNCFLETCES